MYYGKLTDELCNLLKEYEEKTGEWMPLMEWDGTYEQLKELLIECIKSGIPYDPETMPDDIV
ncbi:MAG: hypothetical protein RR716_05345 [Christensenellaceae bacterium]